MQINFSFMKHYKKYFIASGAFILLGLLLILTIGFDLSNDFIGGTKIQIKFNSEVSEAQIAKDIESFQLNPSITSAGNLTNEIIIKTTKQLDLDQRREVYEVLAQKYDLKPEDNALRASEQIGATIGEETKKKALTSFLYASIAILLYITFRFEWRFGVASVITLVHDVLALCAVYAIFRVPLNSSFIAAVLTIVGYSINDTIVIFDRIREQLKYSKSSDMLKIADESIKSTLKRTINTSLTTIVVVLVMYFLGVDDIKTLTFPLALGIAIGTYSSIFIASPVWLLLASGKSGIDKSLKKQEKIKK